ncbi:hypothetical protein ES703_95050 [subsurface metagenome]
MSNKKNLEEIRQKYVNRLSQDRKNCLKKYMGYAIKNNSYVLSKLKDSIVMIDMLINKFNNLTLEELDRFAEIMYN